MCQLFETVSIINRRVQNIEFHQRRFEKSYFELWGRYPSIFLGDVIISPIENRTIKAKFVYSELQYSIDYCEYFPRTINSFKVVDANNLDYHLKYLNRTDLDTLYNQRVDCDDIIITKNELITDTSIANLYFYDGEKWITPKSPILEGTTRERLLEKSNFITDDISILDIRKFSRIAISNAMIGFFELPANIIIE